MTLGCRSARGPTVGPCTTRPPRCPTCRFTEEAAAAEPRPAWRGWIHLGTFPFAVAMGIVLICLADSGAAKAGSAVFMATSLLMFGVSATYHRFPWGPR